MSLAFAMLQVIDIGYPTSYSCNPKLKKLRGRGQMGTIARVILRQIALTNLPEDEALIADGPHTELRTSS